MIRTYSELQELDTFRERFEYLKLDASVGDATFGHDRWLNQEFYRSTLWRRARRDVIARDLACDLGVEGYELYRDVYVHHMNPMTPDSIKHGDPDNLNPEYLITVSLPTHNAIHFGDEGHLPRQLVERRKGDTDLWTPIGGRNG